MMAGHLSRDLQQLSRLGPRAWLDLTRATFELLLARARLGRSTARELLKPQSTANPPLPCPAVSAQQEILLERVAFAIPRMGARVPWRSDCLIQALAAQRWLARAGISAPIDIGVRKEGEFEAHAWLSVGGRIVTGGDISTFTPLGVRPAERSE